jgi:lysyl-tRNA synthetase class 2
MTQEEMDRTKRLSFLKKEGVDPYPSKADRTHTVLEFINCFENVHTNQDAVTLLGRIKLLRKHGALTFARITDETGQVQIAIRKNILGEKEYDFFHKTIDIGDFLQLTGTAFTTQKGEKTLEVKKYSLISKSILPLPEKWHGISDVETRFRKRYLDLIMNPDVSGRFRMRTKIISAIRSLLDSKNFLEVETPTLQPVYGGGFARPFKTHHNSLDSDFYLRISDEMFLKRLLVGGFEKVYEITKVFRNEGIDHDHNPEFTMLEAQVAYENYKYGMELFEEIFEYVSKTVLKTSVIDHDGIKIDIKRPWVRMSVIDSLEKIGGVEKKIWSDFKNAKEILNLKIKDNSEIEKMTTVGELMALAFEQLVEEKLIQPTIIYDYPIEVSPLAKRCKDNPAFAERFEVFALGSEIGNNYSELNDPVDLEKRFIEEKRRELAGFDEAHQTDYDYLEAIKHGMPPSCGIGIGIDRMVMLLTGSKNIKEIILFPTLRPDRGDV